MRQGRLNILQVNTSDKRGGAAHVARALHRAYHARGLKSWLAVGHKSGQDPFTLAIRHDLAGSTWQRPFWQAEAALARHRFRGARWLRNGLLAAADPRRLADWYAGYEDFHYPGTADLLRMPGAPVDILHLHNLHGRYFDLRQLPRLTASTPTVLSLHDAWLLSGHCAHTMGCERFREGCGSCPDLTLDPAIRRDATAENWQRKQQIYANSRYAIISPSQWLAGRAAASPLAAGLQEMRIIPHGVDLNLFRPADMLEARRALNLPERERILLMVGNGMRQNPWKGYDSARAALNILAESGQHKPLLVIVVGDSAPDEKLNGVTIRYVPYVHDQAVLARYYQAAELFLSASKVEVWGLAITEALASGLPVVATAVGGVPEQVASWPDAADHANGILVPPADAAAIAEAIATLLADAALRLNMGRSAVLRAQSDFDFDRQVEQTLLLYADTMAAWRK